MDKKLVVCLVLVFIIGIKNIGLPSLQAYIKSVLPYELFYLLGVDHLYVSLQSISITLLPTCIRN